MTDEPEKTAGGLEVCPECRFTGDPFLDGKLHEHNHADFCSIGAKLRGETAEPFKARRR